MPIILLFLIWLILAIHMMFLWRTRRKHLRYGCFLLVSSLLLLGAWSVIIDSHKPINLLLLPMYAAILFGLPAFGSRAIRCLTAARLRNKRRRHRAQR